MERTISKSKLKATMLEVFRELEANGGELIVTERGNPVLKIVPIRPKLTVLDVFGDVQGQAEYFEDIDAPTLDEWTEV